MSWGVVSAGNRWDHSPAENRGDGGIRKRGLTQAAGENSQTGRCRWSQLEPLQVPDR